MTSPSASRPGHRPADPSCRPAEPEETLSAQGEAPSGAVSLAELIADSGPLPPDAALECVQRLAERLSLTPAVSCAALEPADVLIDDDGGVWLRSPAAGDISLQPAGMDRLGRLLAFLVTGDRRTVSEGGAAETAVLPSPLSTVAGRLFSQNGGCYRSYEELARDAAVLRGVPPAAHLDRVTGAESTRPDLLESRPASAGESTRVSHVESSADEPSANLGPVIAAVIALSAAIAYAVWQWL